MSRYLLRHPRLPLYGIGISIAIIVLMGAIGSPYWWLTSVALMPVILVSFGIWVCLVNGVFDGDEAVHGALHGLRTNRSLRWLLVSIKFAAPALIVFDLLVPLYGLLQPWQVADARLAEYVGERPILVGLRASHREDYVARRVTETLSRDYVLFPSVIGNPKIVTISQTNGEALVVSESRFGFLADIAWFVIGVGATWWFWFRRKERRDA